MTGEATILVIYLKSLKSLLNKIDFQASVVLKDQAEDMVAVMAEITGITIIMMIEDTNIAIKSNPLNTDTKIKFALNSVMSQ